MEIPERDLRWFQNEATRSGLLGCQQSEIPSLTNSTTGPTISQVPPETLKQVLNSTPAERRKNARAMLKYACDKANIPMPSHYDRAKKSFSFESKDKKIGNPAFDFKSKPSVDNCRSPSYSSPLNLSLASNSIISRTNTNVQCEIDNKPHNQHDSMNHNAHNAVQPLDMSFTRSQLPFDTCNMNIQNTSQKIINSNKRERRIFPRPPIDGSKRKYAIIEPKRNEPALSTDMKRKSGTDYDYSNRKPKCSDKAKPNGEHILKIPKLISSQPYSGRTDSGVYSIQNHAKNIQRTHDTTLPTKISPSSFDHIQKQPIQPKQLVKCRTNERVVLTIPKSKGESVLSMPVLPSNISEQVFSTSRNNSNSECKIAVKPANNDASDLQINSPYQTREALTDLQSNTIKTGENTSTISPQTAKQYVDCIDLDSGTEDLMLSDTNGEDLIDEHMVTEDGSFDNEMSCVTSLLDDTERFTLFRLVISIVNQIKLLVRRSSAGDKRAVDYIKSRVSDSLQFVRECSKITEAIEVAHNLGEWEYDSRSLSHESTDTADEACVPTTDVTMTAIENPSLS